MEVKIIEKTENISYEDIHEILWIANGENRKNGINLNTAMLDGNELSHRIGKDGKCFVALDGEKIIGTISFRLIEINSWYFQGRLPEYMLAGVLPEYQGKHVNSRLAGAIFEYAKKNNYPAIVLTVAENNSNAVKIYLHQGFKPVDYKVYSTLDHNNLVMIKWINACPYGSFKRSMLFMLKKYYLIIRKGINRLRVSDQRK